MARRRNSGDSISLFPFLSILVSIIGCLTLIIVVINLIAMNRGEGQTDEEIERAKAFVRVEKEKEEAQEELDKLRNQLENMIQQNREVLAQKERLTLLQEMLDNAEEIDATREELIAKFNVLFETNARLEIDLERLLAEVEEKQAEIERRKLPPDPARLRVRSTGSGTNTKPFFVELSDAGAYIHRSVSAEPEVIPLASLNQSEDFLKLLDEVASKPFHRLIFLVRGSPGGVQSFKKAAIVVADYNAGRGSRIIPGRVPLPNDGRVDLAVFAQFLEP
ncbi:MAG: hypothetical protein AAF236_07985 [Verrucomicrobiota bacterium]